MTARCVDAILYYFRTQFINLPTVSGKPVDLYLLYSLVTKNGGFHKVGLSFARGEVHLFVVSIYGPYRVYDSSGSFVYSARYCRHVKDPYLPSSLEQPC